MRFLFLLILSWLPYTSDGNENFTEKDALNLIRCSAFYNFYAQNNTSSYEEFLQHESHLLASGSMVAALEIIKEVQVSTPVMAFYEMYSKSLFEANENLKGKIMETNLGQKEVKNCELIKNIQISLVKKIKNRK